MSDQRELDPKETTILLEDENGEGSSSQLVDAIKAGTNGFVRESYRLPVASVAGMSLEIDGQAFDIMDLGLGGVRFVLPRQDLFTIGDTISAITIPLHDNPLTVKGEVVHVSLAPDKTVHCGVKFVFDADTDQVALNSFIQNVLSGMFE